MWLTISMALGLPISIGFGVFLGAMDVMVPVMQTGMISGMVVGMKNTKMEACNIEHSPL